MSAKAALHIGVRETGISKSEPARRLVVDEKEIRRMLSPRHKTKLPRIERALSVLGYHLKAYFVPKKAALRPFLNHCPLSGLRAGKQCYADWLVCAKLDVKYSR